MPRGAHLPHCSTRRSSRINNRSQGYATIKNSGGVEIEDRVESKKRRLNEDQPQPLPATALFCPEDMPSDCTAAEPRRSSRITPGDLVKRETALLKKEQDFKRQATELDARYSSIRRQEEQATLLMAQVAEREAKATLAQLEEHFTCALCYEIMAYPYTLNPGQCGHSFCAICLLKWFFSRLHRLCGGWHESVDCPICRSLLVRTPYDAPRPTFTFPFVPNRVANALLEDSVGKLAKMTSQGGSALPSFCAKTRSSSMKVESAELSCEVAAWAEDGAARREWLKKDSDGRREMNHVSNNWATLEQTDFILLKQKLGV